MQCGGVAVLLISSMEIRVLSGIFLGVMCVAPSYPRAVTQGHGLVERDGIQHLAALEDRPAPVISITSDSGETKRY